MTSRGLDPFRVPGHNPITAGFLAVATLAAVACRSGHEASDDASLRTPQDTESPAAPPCEGECAAKLILLEVDGMDEAAAQRVEAMLAERYAEGILSAQANPSTRLLTILARADSDVTVATALDLVGTLGLHAREASEAAYDEAVAELGPGARTVPTTDRGADLGDGCGAHSALQSLEDSLSPLRTRFDEGKGKLRFIALLSPT